MHAGTRSNHTVDTSGSAITQSGVVAPVSNGETFVIDDASQVRTFEFDDTGIAGTVLLTVKSFSIADVSFLVEVLSRVGVLRGTLDAVCARTAVVV